MKRFIATLGSWFSFLSVFSLKYEFPLFIVRFIIVCDGFALIL